jgi:uncharacterized protein with FMN-binding domain
MRRITFAFMSTVAAVVLLFSYRTSTGGATSPAAVAGGAPGIVSGQADPSPAPSPSAAAGAGPNGDDTGTATAPSPSAPSAPKPSAAAKPKTSKVVVNGSVAQTRWGPVQVQVTITGGRITDIAAIQYPQGNGRDAEINSYALPVLHDQAIQKQNAQLDGVSGATVTSDGYVQSLQAALDAAHA